MFLVIGMVFAANDARAVDPPKDETTGRLLVLDLVSSGVDASLTANLSEVFAAAVREALPNSAVIGQNEIKSMLAVERQKDLLGCSDDVACLAEIGGALGADMLVLGSVGKIEGTYLLSLKLVDSAHAKTVRHVSKEVRGGATNLIEATRQWGAYLVDAKKPAGHGYLDVDGKGTVELDGAAIGTAPLRRVPAAAGAHRLVWKEGQPLAAVAETSVEVLPYETLRVGSPTAAPSQPVVNKGFGKLKVEGSPVGANVFVDGELRGIAPVGIESLTAGTLHSVRIEAAGFEPRDESVSVLAGQERVLAFELVNAKGYERPRSWDLGVTASMIVPNGSGIRVEATGSDTSAIKSNGTGSYKAGLLMTFQADYAFSPYFSMGFAPRFGSGQIDGLEIGQLAADTTPPPKYPFQLFETELVAKGRFHWSRIELRPSLGVGYRMFTFRLSEDPNEGPSGGQAKGLSFSGGLETAICFGSQFALLANVGVLMGPKASGDIEANIQDGTSNPKIFEVQVDAGPFVFVGLGVEVGG